MCHFLKREYPSTSNQSLHCLNQTNFPALVINLCSKCSALWWINIHMMGLTMSFGSSYQQNTTKLTFLMLTKLHFIRHQKLYQYINDNICYLTFTWDLQLIFFFPGQFRRSWFYRNGLYLHNAQQTHPTNNQIQHKLVNSINTYRNLWQLTNIVARRIRTFFCVYFIRYSDH